MYVRLAATLLLCLTSALGSDPKDNPNKKNPVLVELTPVEVNMQLLETAQTELAKAPAPLRTANCIQAAQGYGRINADREAAQLKQCFGHSLAIEAQDLALKTTLQFRILDTLYTVAPEATRELLPSAEPRARANIEGRILQNLVNNKNYDEAVTEMSRFAYAPGFPYETAATLMVNLGKERDQDRRLVFSAALQSYRLESATSDPKVEDLATLVIRFWRDLPSPLVLQAIDELLHHAKQSLKDSSAPSMTVGTGLGEAQFSSGYQYRLFELMPILENLDPIRAESIKRDNPRLAQVLNEYPQGLQSIEPTFRDTPLRTGESRRFMITYRLPGANAQQGNTQDLVRAQASRRAAEITKSLTDDPKGALEQAMQLPDSGLEETLRSPRADALARIAVASRTKHPEVSDEALKDLLKVVADYPALPRSFYLLTASRIYYSMKDFSAANELIAHAADIAAELYQRDRNLDSPNQAFKFDWPSTAVWRACLVLQNKIDSPLAIHLLNQIKDAEIKANLRVALANERLGVPLPSNIVRQQFGKDSGSVQEFPLMH